MMYFFPSRVNSQSYHSGIETSLNINSLCTSATHNRTIVELKHTSVHAAETFVGSLFRGLDSVGAWGCVGFVSGYP